MDEKIIVDENKECYMCDSKEKRIPPIKGYEKWGDTVIWPIIEGLCPGCRHENILKMKEHLKKMYGY